MQPENIQVVLPFSLNSRNMMKFDSAVELSLKQYFLTILNLYWVCNYQENQLLLLNHIFFL